MSKFEKVIGYETIKNELMQVCDMLKNKEVYHELGAKFPNGVLLYGEPGLGKTLMARCFIDECNLETFTIRKNKSENFVGYITEIFEKAKEKAPSIIFLDDMDKFANEDNNHKDAEEYVAIQAGIDDVKGCDVFVLAIQYNKSDVALKMIRIRDTLKKFYLLDIVSPLAVLFFAAFCTPLYIVFSFFLLKLILRVIIEFLVEVDANIRILTYIKRHIPNPKDRGAVRKFLAACSLTYLSTLG